MSDIPNEGTYDGEVTAVLHETDPFDPDGIVLAWTVRVPALDRTVTCRHSIGGTYASITERILGEVFALPWPEGIERVEATVGQTVKVRIKHREKNGKTYWSSYIQPPPKRGEPATATAVKRAVSRLQGFGDDSDVPF